MELRVRSKLFHAVPAAVRPEAPIFFLTICCQPRGEDQLCLPRIAEKLFESARFLHARGDWWLHVILLMPDHLHILASFPAGEVMSDVITNWKKYTARVFGISWQRDFFDHRLRREESLRDKSDYILQNPVRAGLVKRAGDWPYVWWPEKENGGLGQPALPTTIDPPR